MHIFWPYSLSILCTLNHLFTSSTCGFSLLLMLFCWWFFFVFFYFRLVISQTVLLSLSMKQKLWVRRIDTAFWPLSININETFVVVRLWSWGQISCYTWSNTCIINFLLCGIKGSRFLLQLEETSRKMYHFYRVIWEPNSGCAYDYLHVVVLSTIIRSDACHPPLCGRNCCCRA
jgi:hypothetical protein